jgi:myosin heavy subunit
MSCHSVADLVQLMLASQDPLLAQLAVGIAASQDKRGSQTVGNRFREQLQDLITRLDQCVLSYTTCQAP